MKAINLTTSLNPSLQRREITRKGRKNFLRGTSKNLPFKRKLRREMTTPERILWSKLRAKQLGIHFRRQHGIGLYIVDFYSHEANLVVEIDGDTHDSVCAEKYDQKRTDFLNQLGLKVVRYTNQDVMQNLAGVVDAIHECIVQNNSI